jgi:uncharacterized protein (TIGR02246 family)
MKGDMMRRYLFMVLIGIVLFPTASCTQDRQKEEAAIQALSDKFATAWNQADGTAMAMMYSEDGCLIDPFGVEARGRQAVESLLTQTVTTALKGTTTRFTMDYIRFLKPDIAFVDATQFINGAMSPEGEPLPEAKLHLVLSVVKKNGQWWFVDARPYWFRLPPQEAMEQ